MYLFLLIPFSIDRFISFNCVLFVLLGAGFEQVDRETTT